MTFFKASENKKSYVVVSLLVFSFLFCSPAFADDSAKWSLYSNKNLGFAVKYPKDWKAAAGHAQLYRLAKLRWKFNVCFNLDIGPKDEHSPCTVELYMTDDVDRFEKQNTEAFLGFKKIQGSEFLFSPPVKDSSPTRRVDVLERQNHITNVYLEKDNRVYLFVMPFYTNDQYDYNVFLTMISSFVLFEPTEEEPQSTAASETFRTLFNLKKDQSSHVQMKVSYVGGDGKRVHALGISSDGAFAKSKFAELKSPTSQSDDSPLDILRAQSIELQNTLVEMNSYPDMVDETPGDPPYLSVVFLNADGSEDATYFETALDHQQSQEFFLFLRKVFEDNKYVSRFLQNFGCALSLLPPVPAEEVTQAVKIEEGGVRLNRQTGRFEQTLTLTNSSQDPLDGPISLLIHFEGETRLLNADGLSCLVSPVGRDFIDIPLPSGKSGQFFPGEKLEVILEFENLQSPVAYSTKIFSGKAER